MQPGMFDPEQRLADMDLEGIDVAVLFPPGSGEEWAMGDPDFAAALCFIIGSMMFFSASLQTPATWFFTIGSVFFAMKPTLRLWREIKLYRMGETKTLADRLG